MEVTNYSLFSPVLVQPCLNCKPEMTLRKGKYVGKEMVKSKSCNTKEFKKREDKIQGYIKSINF